MAKVIRKKLLGDVAVAARYMPFAMSKARALVNAGLEGFSKNYDFVEAVVRIWTDPSNVYVTVEGVEQGGYGVTVNAAATTPPSPTNPYYLGLAKGATVKPLATASPEYVDFLESCSGNRLVYESRDSGALLMRLYVYSFATKTLTEVASYSDSGDRISGLWDIGMANEVIAMRNSGFQYFNTATGAFTATPSTPADYNITQPNYYRSYVRLDSGRLLFFASPAARTSRYFTSDDNGVNWTQRTMPDTGAANYDTTHFEHLGGGVVVFGGVYVPVGAGSINDIPYRFYKSTDNGLTWTLKQEEFALPETSKVAYWSAAAGNMILVQGHNRIFYSANAGETWTQYLNSSFYPITASTGHAVFHARTLGHKYGGSILVAWLDNNVEGKLSIFRGTPVTLDPVTIQQAGGRDMETSAGPTTYGMAKSRR